MKAEILSDFSNMLRNNLGQRMTDELATGFLHVLASRIPDDPPPALGEEKVGADAQTPDEGERLG